MGRTKILKGDLETSIQSVIDNSSYLGGKVAGSANLSAISPTADMVVYVANSKKFVAYHNGSWVDIIGSGSGGGTGTGVTELNLLDDVNVASGISDGQVLAWDETSSSWIPTNVTVDTSTIEANITSLETEVATKANQSTTYTKTEVDSLLTSKTTVGHTHAIGDITNLETSLNGKASSIHTHAISEVTNLESSLNGKASLASPAFTGTPTAPTATTSDNSTQIATTAFVKAQGYLTSADLISELAVIDGGTF